MSTLANINGDSVSVVPSVIAMTIVDASSADVDFNGLRYMLASEDGTIVVKDKKGNTASVIVTEGTFFPAMISGIVASGSDAISLTIWS